MCLLASTSPHRSGMVPLASSDSRESAAGADPPARAGLPHTGPSASSPGPALRSWPCPRIRLWYSATSLRPHRRLRHPRRGVGRTSMRPNSRMHATWRGHGLAGRTALLDFGRQVHVPHRATQVRTHWRTLRASALGCHSHSVVLVSAAVSPAAHSTPRRHE